MDKECKVQRQINIIKDLGHELSPKAMILDLGCGNGDAVMGFINSGYQAYGCDFSFSNGVHAQDLHEKGLIRKINESPYTLPFPDNTFDVVLSDQVFEHVKDYASTLAEISRVLKPEGVGLHYIPSRYSIIEQHVYVPLATLIQQRWWLLLWAYLGIRKKQQRGMPAAAVAQRNFDFLRGHTNYLKRSDIVHHFSANFRNIVFCEDIFIRNNQHSRKSIFLYRLSNVFKFIPKVYSTMRMMVLFSENNKIRQAGET